VSLEEIPVSLLDDSYAPSLPVPVSVSSSVIPPFSALALPLRFLFFLFLFFLASSAFSASCGTSSSGGISSFLCRQVPPLQKQFHEPPDSKHISLPVNDSKILGAILAVSGGCGF
jgi:hypothetical protein